jgi:transcriptional regulator with XRE-family HTH domain
MTNKELIQTIKTRKDILAVNQEYLAELSGVGIATLKRFESGKGNITLKNLQKIADVLGLEVNLEIKKAAK